MHIGNHFPKWNEVSAESWSIRPKGGGFEVGSDVPRQEIGEAMRERPFCPGDRLWPCNTSGPWRYLLDA